MNAFDRPVPTLAQQTQYTADAVNASAGQAPAQRTGWQAQFHSALISYLVAHGTLVAQSPTEYSWKAYGKLGPGQGWGWDPAAHHVQEDCAISFERSTFEDSDWIEWGGTFDPDEHTEGIDAIVTCRCGQVSGRRWRYTEGHATLLRGITGG